MKSPEISATRVRLLLIYAFVILGATLVAFYRAAHPGLWIVAFGGSIPLAAALVGGWPERSGSAERKPSRQD